MAKTPAPKVTPEGFTLAPHANALTLDEIGCPTLSPLWTLEERLAAVAFLAGVISNDVAAGRYSAPGRPNGTSIQYVCALSAEDLEAQDVRGAIRALAEEMRSVLR